MPVALYSGDIDIGRSLSVLVLTKRKKKKKQDWRVGPTTTTNDLL